MHEEAFTDIINTIFEGLISLSVIIGSGLLIASKPDTATVALCASATSAVLVFWFGQRGTSKATDGTITALSKLSTQIGAAQDRSNLATVDANTVSAAVLAKAAAAVLTTAEQAAAKTEPRHATP